MNCRNTAELVLVLALAVGSGPSAVARPFSWTCPGGHVQVSNDYVLVRSNEGRGGVATAPIDLGPYAGEALVLSVRGESTGVSVPPKPWNGIKVMLSYRDALTGKTCYSSSLNGSFGDIGPEVFRTYADLRGKRATDGLVSLGLEDVNGRVRFDLRTLKVERAGPCAYTPSVAARGSLRGFMLPAGREPDEDDFATLAKWGARLARFQMVRTVRDEGDRNDRLAFDRWLDERMDWLDRALALAEKHDIRLVVDMHSTPGGDSGATGNWRIFETGPWARDYLDSWRRLAGRFRGRKGIYAFDLVNEPRNPNPKAEDCWNLQCKAAEIVRAIDPLTPVSVESDWGGMARPFAWMCPLPLTNVIYQVHLYVPTCFTHQLLNGRGRTDTAYPGVFEGELWNRERLRRELAPVRDFQLRYGARILVGEFSAVAWAKGADRWLSDAISLFNEYGWDWTYHAFRESSCWSLEHEGASQGDMKPSADNPRKAAVLDGLRNGSRADGKPRTTDPVRDASFERRRYRFDDPSVRVPVYYDALSPIEAGSRAAVAVVLIHGWGGHVRTLLPVLARALAARARNAEATPYVVAPLFPRRETLASNREPEDGRAVWGDSWADESSHPERMGSASDDWRGGGDANGTRFSSFDYVDRIFARLGDRRSFPNLSRVVLAGFSAGGQFAGRYAAVGRGVVRDGVTVVYMDMSPSTEFRFEKDDPWLYGLKDRPRYAAHLTDADIMRNLCSRRVWHGCGSEDTLGRPRTSLDMTPPAVRQGANRLERFRNFAAYLDHFPAWKKQASFHVFEGIGHKEDLAYQTDAVLDFIFGDGPVPPAETACGTASDSRCKEDR